MSKTNEAMVAACSKGMRVVGGEVYGVRGGVLKLKVDSSGYPIVSACYNGVTYPVRVHRIVAYAKYGDALFESGIVTRHLDSDPMNFDSDNIVIGTESQNRMDMPEGERRRLAQNAANVNRKYSDEMEAAMCNDYVGGMGYSKLGSKYNMSRSTARAILIRNGRLLGSTSLNNLK